MGILTNQTAARLILQTNLDLNNLTIDSCSIAYIKPSGASGKWAANKLPGYESEGKIYVDFTEDVNFDEGGIWILNAEIVFSDGRTGLGDTIRYQVKNTA